MPSSRDYYNLNFGTAARDEDHHIRSVAILGLLLAISKEAFQ